MIREITKLDCALLNDLRLRLRRNFNRDCHLFKSSVTQIHGGNTASSVFLLQFIYVSRRMKQRQNCKENDEVKSI